MTDDGMGQRGSLDQQIAGLLCDTREFKHVFDAR